MTPEPLTRLQRIERAEKEVLRLCNGRDRSFRMTVPADPDRDSDLLLIDGLDAGREAEAAHTDADGLSEAQLKERLATILRRLHDHYAEKYGEVAGHAEDYDGLAEDIARDYIAEWGDRAALADRREEMTVCRF